ncbi:carbamoyltransferase HypF [Siculibacillus lacustris]|uniref:Carbamoyltransferase HypF n=1 Tax=Siculibacillus lacustris TaxID=1549641 RepID=A0A4Q9VW27_9HYPH|nr:carbamoyltransferase HypF [Siculibacillus lacustris]TBW40023.1 carbamoyltransferase HypF [Siculibacillus lacustris]
MAEDPAPAAPSPVGRPVERLRIRVRGAVQGVGMRPFVHRLATELGLAGHVLNDGDGVAIEVEGSDLAAFLARLEREAPPLARLESVVAEALASTGARDFRIDESVGGRVTTRVPPDAATCPACLGDLFDPTSRFHRYPFVNCTHCGPRFTITARLPYDRPQTAMAGFAMCPACARDYRDPTDRRFHAEPIACPACGPRLTRPVADIVAALKAGRIVAVKGLGGFHLMCDAGDEAVVAELRRRKNRDAKPFAVMVADAGSLDRVARPSAAERALFASTAAPIVVMAAVPGAVAPSVAPRLGRIGVMAAHTPLHHLIFREAAGGPFDRAAPDGPNPFVVVATSANPGGEPLVVDDTEAERRLAGIADLIVGHDRPIVIRADDSVAGVIDGAPAFLRRSRGFVPEPIDLGADGPPVLATGAYLKTTVTVTRGREAFVSQHVGDLDTVETLRFHRETAAHLLALLDVRPAVVACDLHPDFASSRFAGEFDVPVVAVQHHAAHVAAIAAEHRVAGPIFGLALDGIGHGDDGGAWGGEALRLDGGRWTRLGHLAPLALPGGDRAAREPWRMALAALAHVGALDRWPALLSGVPAAGAVAKRLEAGREATTTSAGRLFDAAAALLGVRLTQDHEAQAAMELEALVTAPVLGSGLHTITDGVLDFAPLIERLARGDLDAAAGADLFHGALIDGLADWSAGWTRPGDAIALGGGCLMNRVLAEGLCGALRDAGRVPLLARAVPANDGGLSLGQAAMARAIAIRVETHGRDGPGAVSLEDRGSVPQID